MSSVLVNGLTDIFKSQLSAPFAAHFGESESSAIHGFETGIGAMLLALRSKIGQAGFVRQLSDLINSPANDTRLLENARPLIESQGSNTIGNRFLSMMFGNKLSAASNAIGDASGLRPTSASGLMTIGAPLLLGMLGKHVRETGMDTSRLAGFLRNEADGIRGELPRGVESAIGESTTVPPIASAVLPAGAAVREHSTRRWLFLPILAALILGLLWWAGSRGPRHHVASVPSVTPPATGFASRELPGNIDLHIPPGGMEDRLLSFIQDPSRPADNTTWFEFDRLHFDTNSATLQPGSDEQLQNIAAILKAYPNVHIKIGGYTDNTGDPAANMTLSQQRADAVKQQLVSMGISPDRLESQGYGEQHPVADNTTEEGRQKNRRIAVRVTQK